MKQILSTSLTSLRKMLKNLEDSPLHLWHFASVFLSIMIVRVLMEAHITGGFLRNDMLFSFYEFVHIGLLFLTMLFGVLFVLKYVLHIPFAGGSVLVLVLLLPLILLSPLIDTYVFSHIELRSYYEFYSLSQLFSEFFGFMGHSPFEGTTPGQRAMILLTLILVAPFAYWRAHNHKLLRSILTTLFIYILFYITVTLPSFVTLAVRGFSEGFLKLSDIHIAQLFFTPLLSPSSIVHVPSAYALHFKMILVFIVINTVLCGLFLFLSQKKIFCALLANVRPLQVCYHFGLFAFGVLVAISVRDYILFLSFFNILILCVALLSIALAWYTSVVVNDLFDTRIDEISNTKRPLPLQIIAPSTYATVGIICFILSSFLMFYIDVYAGFMLLGYHALTFLYSAHPFRLKRVPLVATAVCALSSLLIVFIGYSLLHPSHTIADFPAQLGLLIFFTLTLSLPLKDLKDIEGDRADSVWTLPALFGMTIARVMIGTSIFISYLLSVYFFAEPNLFFHALIAGSISFFTLTARKSKKDTSLETSSVQFLFSSHNVPLFIFMALLYYCGALLTHLTF